MYKRIGHSGALSKVPQDEMSKAIMGCSQSESAVSDLLVRQHHLDKPQDVQR